MAKYGSGNVGFLLVGGYSLLASDVFDVSGPSNEAIGVESTALGDAWTEHLPSGLRKSEFSQNGLFDDVSTGINAALTGNQATSNVVSVTFTGATIGNKFVGAAGMFAGKQTRIAQRGDLHRMNIAYTVTGEVEEGTIFLPPTAKTADDLTPSSQDNTVASSNGGAGYLHVTAYSGFTSVVVKIQTSTDNVSFNDRITFATVTAIGAERKTTSNTLQRYARYSVDVTGSGSITLMIGMVRFA